MFLIARLISRLLRPLVVLGVIYVLFFSSPAEANVLESVVRVLPGPGAIGALCLIILATIAFMQEVGRRRRQAIREEVFGLDNIALFQFLDAMCHAAAADAKTEREEISFIRDLAADLTGLDYTPAHIAEAIACCEQMSRPGQFRKFGEGLDVNQRRLVLHGALSVILSDNGVTKSEQAFLRNLAKGLEISKAELSEMIDSIMVRIESATGEAQQT